MPREFRFIINVLPTGAVVAKAVDLDMEVAADNLEELRDRLTEKLKPFDCTPTLIGIRTSVEKPSA